MRSPLRCRAARPAPAWRNVAKTGAQTIAFWGVFLFLIPPMILWIEIRTPLAHLVAPSTMLRVLAVSVFGMAGALGLWSGWVMAVRGAGTPLPSDAPNQLVTSGPYAHVRNPMSIGGLAQGAAIAAWHGSVSVLLYVLIGMVVWNFCVRPWEERDLVARFGASFIEYRRAVRCWTPRLTPYVAAQSSQSAPTA